jgi:predicted nucleotidyltransferase
MKPANPFSTLTETSLEEIVRRLVPALHPRLVYLFGSHARGVPHPDSDIDLMIITDSDDSHVELYRLGRQALRGAGLPVELHFSTAQGFNRYADVFGSFQHEVKRKGILIYAAEN